MKKLGRILSILALVLVLCAMFGLVVRTGLHILLLGTNPLIAISWQIPLLLTYIPQLVCIVPLIFLVGRKKGGAVIEILLLVFMIFCVPVINGVAQYVWHYLYEFIYDFINNSGASAVRDLPEMLEYALSIKGVYRYFDYGAYDMGTIAGCIKYIMNNLRWEAFEYVPGNIISLLNAGITGLAQILTYVVCGISIALTAKNRKEKIAD